MVASSRKLIAPLVAAAFGLSGLAYRAPSAAAIPAQCMPGTGAYSGSSGPAETNPVARFTYKPLQPLVASAVTFDASASRDQDGDAIVAYSWSFGDGTAVLVSSTPVVRHTFADAGRFTVSLSVLDCRDTASKLSMPIAVGVAICRSHRSVTLALPHARGTTVRSVTVASGGRTLRSYHGSALTRRSLKLSFFGFPKSPVTVTVKIRRGGRTTTKRHVYRPCQSGHSKA